MSITCRFLFLWVAIFVIPKLDKCYADVDSLSPITFTQPTIGHTFSSTVCTLSVETVKDIKQVEFKIKYLPNDNTPPMTVSLGTISRKPFKGLWDITGIPNQLTDGATFIAVGKTSDGSEYETHQEGIFLAHNKIEVKSYDLLYGRNVNIGTPTIVVTDSSRADTLILGAVWNEMNIKFSIDVKNSFFYEELARKKVSKFGIKLMIDTKLKRKSYLSQDILMFNLPVISHPYRIITKSIYKKNGDFEISYKRKLCAYPFNAVLHDFSGYSYTFEIPTEDIFKNTKSDSFALNVMVDCFDDEGHVVPLAWSGLTIGDIYSPKSYGVFVIKPRSLFQIPLVLFAISFLITFAVVALLHFLIKVIIEKNSIGKFETSENDQVLMEKIDSLMAAEIVTINFTIESISTKLKTTPKHVNRLIKQKYKRSFSDHIVACRIELAKELLRSSNSSEISIAKMCGFQSINEMEKKFKAFVGMSPYQYRNKNRIS